MLKNNKIPIFGKQPLLRYFILYIYIYFLLKVFGCEMEIKKINEGYFYLREVIYSSHKRQVILYINIASFNRMTLVVHNFP